jgi:glutamate racemase
MMRSGVFVSNRRSNLYKYKNLDLSSLPSFHQGSIGVFDSGVGGLTVLRQLQRQLPQESFLYFADTAHVPYGTRPQHEIVELVRQILDWMVSQQVKMAVMACNTSSALALEIVRSEFEIPILGLILPGARAAVRTGRRIGVIATPATVYSNSYPQAIQEANPQAQVWQMGCPEFVPLIEGNRIQDSATVAVARQYLQPLLEQHIDTLIYGCTHYPHLAPVIEPLLPPGVQPVDPAVHVAAAAAAELKLLGLNLPRSQQSTRFCVSGCPEQFAQVSCQWLGYLPQVENVLLPGLSPVQPVAEPALGQRALVQTDLEA